MQAYRLGKAQLMNSQAIIEDINFHNDLRVRATYPVPYQLIQLSESHATLTISDDLLSQLIEDNEIAEDHSGSFQLSSEYTVCAVCRGTGTMVNPSIDCDGLTAEDFAEDPGFAEDYFSGAYDQQCSGCCGRRVQIAADFTGLPNVVCKAIDAWLQAEADYLAECAAERRAGC